MILKAEENRSSTCPKPQNPHKRQMGAVVQLARLAIISELSAFNQETKSQYRQGRG